VLARAISTSLVYNIRKLDFLANLCEAFAEDKRQRYCGDLVLGGEFSTRLFSTISEQDFNQNVGEVAYSIYLAVY